MVYAVNQGTSNGTRNNHSQMTTVFVSLIGLLAAASLFGTTALCAGIPPADDRAGSSRPHAGGTG
jgi:hypothetical protein